MRLTHPARGLKHGSCSRHVTAVRFGTLSWGSWEPWRAFEKESDIRALHADRGLCILLSPVPCLPSRFSLKGVCRAIISPSS